ncbi:MAG: preprotein translocase subunit SecG [Halioglobus sp.]|nr:preprotein translocase subunit SecG [Halioglobus sp.]|tara:strand:- start:217 stop:594 length:378 start_codon:yes stop_codon:yes gene_type:complete
MEQIILVVHLLTALAIIGLIMLQQGKGADMGASFGAGASQTLFGSDGSGNALTRGTTWLVVVFFSTSFGLAILANQNSAAIDELDLAIPDAPAAEVRAVEEELPVIEQDAPAVIESAGDDLPSLD